MHSIFVLLILLSSPSLLFARDLTRIRSLMPKFREVTPAIYAGPNPVSKLGGFHGLDEVLAIGIKTTVNLQGGDIDGTWIGHLARLLQKGETETAIQAERDYVEARGIEFFNYPLNSHAPVSVIMDEDIRRALDVLARATPENPVFIHCEHGKDRTGLIIALYRVIYQNWAVADAYAEWVRWGHTRTARLVTGPLDVYFYNFLKTLSEPASCGKVLKI